MKRMIMLLLGLLAVLAMTSPVYADEVLRASSIDNLYGSYKDGKITIYWNSWLENSGGPSASNIIKIYRGDSPGIDVGRDTPVATIDVNQIYKLSDLDSKTNAYGTTYKKWLAFSWDDASAERGKTYYYEVVCSSFLSHIEQTSVEAIDQAEAAAQQSQKRTQFEQQVDWSERLCSSIILAIPNFFANAIGLTDPMDLIFQDQISPQTTENGVPVVKMNGVKFHVPETAKPTGGMGLQGEIQRVGGNVVNSMRSLVTLIAVLFVMWTGFVFASGYNDSNKIAMAKKMVAGLVVCLFLVFAAEKVTGTSLGLIGLSPSVPVDSVIPAVPDNSIILHTFSASEFGQLAQYYDRLSQFVPVSLVVVIVLIGMGALYTSATPNAKISFREYAIGLFLGLLVLKMGIYVLGVIFDINYAMVKFFEWIAGDKLKASFLDTLINTNSGALGQAIITFVAIFSIGVLNWQYTVRKIVIALLIGLIPVIAVISMFPAKRNVLDYWFKELISQVFIQTAHAAVLSFGILFVQNPDVGFWAKLVCVSGLPSIAVMVRKVIGAEGAGSGIVGGLGAMVGVGSIMALGKMLAPKSQKIPGGGAVPGVANVAGGSMGGGVLGGFSPGGIAGKLAGYGLRTASTMSLAAAGSIAAGALTGSPAAGIGAGAMMGSAMSGGAVNMIGKAGSILSMSPEERAQAMGVADPAMLDSPAEAYAAGKNLFGGGIMGKTVAAGFAGFKVAQGFMGKADPGMAKQVRKGITGTQKSLGDAKLQMAEYRPAYDEARANYTYAKNMYSPKSSNRKVLDEKVESLEKERGLKEQPYLEAINTMNNKFDPDESVNQGASWKAGAATQLAQVAKTGYVDTMRELGSTQRTIEEHDKLFNSSKGQFEAAEAEYARHQVAVSGFEQKLTTQGIKKEFEKLRQDRSSSNPDISWR